MARESGLYQRKLANQRLSLEEYRAGKVILRSRPSKLIVELTQNCNFKCIMCDQSLTAMHPQYARYNRALNMEFGLFDRIAEELFPDAYFVDLRGFGESVIYPQWSEIVDRLPEYPLVDWHLVTNLSLPREAVWEKIIQNRFILGISFDGATAETFERIRKRSHFKTILHNLEVVSDAVRRTGFGHLYFVVVIQDDNLEEIPAIVEIARDHGIRDVQLKAIHPGPHGLDTVNWRKRAPGPLTRSLDIAIESETRVTINDESLVQALDSEKVRKAAEIHYPSPRLNFIAPGESASQESIRLMEEIRDQSRVSVHRKCFKPFHYTYVASDGRVGTCNHMLNPRIEVMGDLNTSSFEEIWNGQSYQFFRASLLKGMPMDKRCQWCFRHRLED